MLEALLGRVDGDFGPQKEVLCGELLLPQSFLCWFIILVALIWSERAPEEVLCGEFLLPQRFSCWCSLGDSYLV